MGLIDGIASLLKTAPKAKQKALPDMNDKCWCDSGKKYKECHMQEDGEKACENSATNCGPC